MAAELQPKCPGAGNDRAFRFDASARHYHRLAATGWLVLPELERCSGRDSTSTLLNQT